MRSTQGIAAITASIPALMEDPYIFSAYQNNHITGIPALLKKSGYHSAFFHGANPGSMDFEDFAHLCGFDRYFDRSDFNNDQFYDGHWGIWDRPFFQYTAQALDTFREPFYAQLFSLSSHHPYQVERDFEALYPKLDPLARSIRYTDDALGRFFQTARKMDWFDRTLFIITADHTGFSSKASYQTRTGRYRIPLLLYRADATWAGRQKGIAQQLDILPTVINYVKSNHSFTSFGSSLLDSTLHRYVYMYDNQMYQILDERFMLLFDGETSIALYDYEADDQLKKNLIKTLPTEYQRLERQLKAVLQQHHNSLIRNELTVDR
jgi:phosphoglycerol transferase MdoB-like AlkP superfamily enzyme